MVYLFNNKFILSFIKLRYYITLFFKYLYLYKASKPNLILVLLGFFYNNLGGYLKNP